MSVIEQAALILHAKRCSCVIVQNGNVRLCHEHGIKDLYQILKEEPEVLLGATVADKVIGKGAAALMILGGVKEVYADVISRPALKLFLTVYVHTNELGVLQALQYSEYYLVTTIYPGLSGITNKDHRK